MVERTLSPAPTCGGPICSASRPAERRRDDAAGRRSRPARHSGGRVLGGEAEAALGPFPAATMTLMTLR
jgi:hypothetical protein